MAATSRLLAEQLLFALCAALPCCEAGELEDLTEVPCSTFPMRLANGVRLIIANDFDHPRLFQVVRSGAEAAPFEFESRLDDGDAVHARLELGQALELVRRYAAAQSVKQDAISLN
jgi:hypothetical protein